MNSVMMDRNLGYRCFVNEKDGKVYETVPTGIVGADGKMTYEDKLVSESSLDARAALTATEYKKVDSVVTDVATAANRFSAWMRSLTSNVDRFNGMDRKTYWYNIVTGQTTSSRSTMDLEDDAPGTTVATTEDGVPLPLEFADWLSNIRRDASASAAAGYDVSAQKAKFAAEAVAIGTDLRQINGWAGLTYNGVTVYGLRDVPTTAHVHQAGTISGYGWLDVEHVTPAQIFADITLMVKAMNVRKIPGPYVLILPESFRFRLAETYSTDVNGNKKSLWMAILERPAPNIPNVLGISEIKLVPEMDETKGGGTPTAVEAYLLSLDPRYFRVLQYLNMQSFTIDLKGGISTKHRVVEGLCPLFKKNANGYHGVVKLETSAS